VFKRHSWLRNRDPFPNGSVNLVYLDPPFNSNLDYNILFREESRTGRERCNHGKGGVRPLT